MKRRAAVLAVVAGSLGLGVVVSAQGYNDDSAAVAISDPTPAGGTAFTVTVDNCVPPAAVVFDFGGATQRVSCLASGSASAEFTAPIAQGTYSGTATITGDGSVLTFSIAVVASSSQRADADLATTGGGSSRRLMTAGVVLAASGAAMLGVARFRRRRVTGC